jgi:hypothetical protein
MLFVHAHFHTFHLIEATQPTCVFSLVDDMYIIGPTLYVVLIFLRLLQEFSTLRLLMQLAKCVTWFP